MQAMKEFEPRPGDTGEPRHQSGIWRWLPAVALGSLALMMLRRRSPGRAALGLFGVGLLARGVLDLLSGPDDSDLGARSETETREEPEAQRPAVAVLNDLVEFVSRELLPARDYDRVDESSDESFPASDSPSWTPITGIGGP